MGTTISLHPLLIASLGAHRSISSRRASRGRCLSEIALQGLVKELAELLRQAFVDPWREVSIDRFLLSFFFDHLPSSTSLQPAFRNQRTIFADRLLLERRSTRFERMQRLIKEISELFLLDHRVQQVAVRSKSLLDRPA